MKFDSNLAWKQASSAIAANREVLLALAGVFFLLPTLAFSLLLPQPEPAAGLDNEATMALMSQYYSSVLPYFIPMALIQGAGTLAMLALFTDRSRPTVGAAIRQGFTGIFPYIAAQLLLGFGFGLAAIIMLTAAAAAGSEILSGIAVALILMAAIYIAIRTSLLAPIIAVERIRNPIAALQRTWRLTAGNAVRLGLFYLLIFIAFILVMMIAMTIVGILLALIASENGAEIAAAVISAALGSVMTLYFVGVVAAVHRQLAGTSAEAASAPFE